MHKTVTMVRIYLREADQGRHDGLLQEIMSILHDEQGLDQGSIGFAKDIREIRKHDRLVTLGEVAVALCHEINSPLEVILNEMALLETFVRRTATDDEAVVEEEREAGYI